MAKVELQARLRNLAEFESQLLQMLNGGLPCFFGYLEGNRAGEIGGLAGFEYGFVVNDTLSTRLVEIIETVVIMKVHDHDVLLERVDPLLGSHPREAG